jgi:hypothetical protein
MPSRPGASTLGKTPNVGFVRVYWCLLMDEPEGLDITSALRWFDHHNLQGPLKLMLDEVEFPRLIFQRCSSEVTTLELMDIQGRHIPYHCRNVHKSLSNLGYCLSDERRIAKSTFNSQKPSPKSITEILRSERRTLRKRPSCDLKVCNISVQWDNNYRPSWRMTSQCKWTWRLVKRWLRHFPSDVTIIRDHHHGSSQEIAPFKR